MKEAELRPHVLDAVKGGFAALIALIVYELVVLKGWIGSLVIPTYVVYEEQILVGSNFLDSYLELLLFSYFMIFGFGFIAVLAAKMLRRPAKFIGFCVLFIVGVIVWMAVVVVEMVVGLVRGIVEVLRG